MSENVRPTNGAFAGGDVEVARRYLYTCGIAAWYCASKAKMTGVNPAGR